MSLRRGPDWVDDHTLSVAPKPSKVNRLPQIKVDFHNADEALSHVQKNVGGNMKPRIQAIRDQLFDLYKEMRENAQREDDAQ